MSGSKQHFIPRHFLKPFVIPDGNDKLWMYRRGLKKPVAVDRLDAAAQKHFYSKQGENGQNNLDDLITEYEKKIGAFVDRCRLLEIGADIAPYEIAEIIVHFSLRSAHTRGVVKEGLKSIGNTVSAVLADPFSFFGKQAFPAHKPPKKIRELLKEALEDEDYPKQTGMSSETLSRIAYIVLREQSEKIIGDVDKSVVEVLNHFLGETSHAASFVHRNLLSKTLAPEKRVEQFSQLKWRVVAHESARAILPDCVCFGVEKTGILKPLFALDIEEIQYAILPLTHSTLAIGCKDENFEYDTEIYNDHAKKMSFDFFLTGELQEADGRDLENLGGEIRADLRKFLDKEFTSALGSYSGDDEEYKLPNVIVDESEQNLDLGFQVFFKGGFDANSEKALTQELNLLLCDFLQPSVIDHLDGFTFAPDYEVALNELDRGIEGAGELKSENSKRGTGVAMPITVLRNGELKTHIVARDF